MGFCVDVLESQFLPESGFLYDLFFVLDAAVTGFFTFDLAVNLFANSADCFREFYINPANWFDLVIVAVSILGVIQDASGQGSLPFKMIRLVRVLKVMKQREMREMIPVYCYTNANGTLRASPAGHEADSVAVEAQPTRHQHRLLPGANDAGLRHLARRHPRLRRAGGASLWQTGP